MIIILHISFQVASSSSESNSSFPISSDRNYTYPYCICKGGICFCLFLCLLLVFTFNLSEKISNNQASLSCCIHTNSSPSLFFSQIMLAPSYLKISETWAAEMITLYMKMSSIFQSLLSCLRQPEYVHLLHNFINLNEYLINRCKQKSVQNLLGSSSFFSCSPASKSNSRIRFLFTIIKIFI